VTGVRRSGINCEVIDLEERMPTSIRKTVTTRGL